jgi:two-component system response regulator WspF
VNTPVFGRDGNIAGGQELVRKIGNIVRLRCGKAAGLEVVTPTSPISAPRTATSTAPILAIGASTGGPQALATVLAGLAGPLDYSIVVVQHLDRLFVPGLVDWLARETKLSLQSIEPGQRPLPGKIHVACTSDHLVLTSSGVFQYVREPVDHVYRPSVDVFFASLLKARVSPGVALLLTGMGRDGAAGMKALHQVGWKTIAQDQASSIVWGMPGAAVQLQAADRVVPLDRIGPAVSELMKLSKV